MSRFNPDDHWDPPGREVFVPDAWERDPDPPVGVILDRRGGVLRVVEESRRPFGFQSARRRS